MDRLPAKLSSSAEFSALLADTADECVPVLAGMTGTHALSLDALDGPPPPQLPGLGRWTALRITEQEMLRGPLRASAGALPFLDDSFCVVLIRHAAGCGAAPERLAAEASRVLAPHGVLLVVELHPYSGWRPWLAARWRRGDESGRVVAPSRWERALRATGLAIRGLRRVGAPWPRQQGLRGLPRWAARCGGVYLLAARKNDDGNVVQRLGPKRMRSVGEHTSWAPRAQRTRG